ncbi:hypothetical protein MRB53_039673 [Persea americana]|nr:hypothetical protein MRB53_039673 [Persea americana]
MLSNKKWHSRQQVRATFTTCLSHPLHQNRLQAKHSNAGTGAPITTLPGATKSETCDARACSIVARCTALTVRYEVDSSSSFMLKIGKIDSILRALAGKKAPNKQSEHRLSVSWHLPASVTYTSTTPNSRMALADIPFIYRAFFLYIEPFSTIVGAVLRMVPTKALPHAHTSILCAIVQHTYRHRSCTTTTGKSLLCIHFERGASTTSYVGYSRVEDFTVRSTAG